MNEEKAGPEIATLDDVRELFLGLKPQARKLAGPIFYVTNDANHGAGPETFLPHYGIVCIDDNPLLRQMEEAGLMVFSLERELGEKNVVFRSSEELLSHEKAQAYLEAHRPEGLLFFKTSSAIEETCQKKGWRLLAAPTKLGRYFENKLRFQEVLERLNIPSPPGEQVDIQPELYEELSRRYGRFVVQFAKGFGGNRTFLIEEESSFRSLAEENPGRKVRISRYMEGHTLTINACVTRHGVAIADLFYQITGLPECTAYRLGACGNDWLYPLPDETRRRAFAHTRAVGKYMAEAGYRGIFGLDFVAENRTGEVFTIENNARLIASIPLFTRLQVERGEIPLLALHILELMGMEYELDIEQVNEKLQKRKKGAQLILHNLEGAPAEVQGDLPSGVYTLNPRAGLKPAGGELTFRRPGYSLEDCHSDEEFLILAADKGRVVNPNIECARFQARRPLLRHDSHLAGWAQEVARSIYKALALRPIGH